MQTGSSKRRRISPLSHAITFSYNICVMNKALTGNRAVYLPLTNRRLLLHKALPTSASQKSRDPPESPQVLKARSNTLSALMSSPNPSLSFGMSFGPSSFLVPPGLLLLDRLLTSLWASALSADEPFIREPMLGIVLAPLP